MNLTIFGMLLRKIRLDRLMRLKEMAEGVGVTSAFLSSVESGNKEIPESLVQNLLHFLKLDKEQEAELLRSVDETRKSVTIAMPESNEDRYLIGSFARNLETLDVVRKEQILQLLRGKDE